MPRLHTLGDEPCSPLGDDYETPKFNATKELRFGVEDNKIRKEGDFFSFGLDRKVGSCKGKENGGWGSKEAIKGRPKDSSSHSAKTAGKGAKDSASPRRRL
jgi:hypothetical protein